MKQTFLALKGADWEEYINTCRTEVKATEWAFDRRKEAFEKVERDEARKLSTVQEIMIRSTKYLRRIIAPAGVQGGVAMSQLCPHCNSFPMDTTFGGSLEGKTYKSVVCKSVENNTTGSNQTGSWWCKQAKV